MVAFYSALSGDRQGLEQDRPRLQLAPAQFDAALEPLGLRPGGYFVFAPGAEYGPAKRWPATRFAELAKLLDAPALLLGSAKEAALCGEIAGLAGTGRCIDLAGKTSLTDAFALIGAARAVISNDSGLMHVAAALGVPQVALFGSSSPLHTPPLSDAARVFWLKQDPLYQPPLDCSPCFQRECPLGHTRCLYDITAQTVAASLSAAAPRGQAGTSPG
jgi:heptosyltransferase-2